MLEKSVFSFASRGGSHPPVRCSLIHGRTVRDELLVVYAPFADGAPKSSADDIYHYMRGYEHNPISKNEAAPNSWNQISKSGVMQGLLQAVDADMPVLTIFSPVPTHAYSSAERAAFRGGDFTPVARLTAEAVDCAQKQLHGSRSETQIADLHLHGASLGASNAIGAGSGLDRRQEFNIQSVTAQELIIGPKNYFPDLANKFRKPTVGEPSIEIVTKMANYARIGEPAIRQLIDRDGVEQPATAARGIISMLKYSYLKGLTDPAHNETPADIARLAEAGVHLAIVLAANSGLTQETAQYLPASAQDSVVGVRAENGHRVAHLLDEHVTPTVLLAAMNVARARRPAPSSTNPR